MAPQGCDPQIIFLLKTLIGIIKSHLDALPTPTGKAAAQILETLTPVLDCLAQSHVVPPLATQS